MRAVAGLFMLLMLGTFAPASLYTPLPVPDRAWVRFTPLVADAAAGCRLDGAALEGGWVLTSNHPGFGGLSGLHVADGRVLAVTDAGEAAEFALAPRGTVPLAMHPLADPRLPKKMRDTESLAVNEAEAWVGFEHRNLIRRYRLPAWQAAGEVRPAAMRDWPKKQGAEAMARLHDGRFLAMAEAGGEALLFDRDPTRGGEAKRLEVGGEPGFKPVDVAALRDGRLLLLRRRYRIQEGPTGFAATLSLGSLNDLRGREIARFARPCLHENFEAVSVTYDNGRETVWLASDDNFGPLQRTLLLKLSLRR